MNPCHQLIRSKHKFIMVSSLFSVYKFPQMRNLNILDVASLFMYVLQPQREYYIGLHILCCFLVQLHTPSPPPPPTSPDKLSQHFFDILLGLFSFCTTGISCPCKLTGQGGRAKYMKTKKARASFKCSSTVATALTFKGIVLRDE